MAGIFSLGLGSLAKSISRDAAPVIDHYFPTVAEKTAATATLEKLAQVPDTQQVRVDVAEAKTGNLFIAGWRPAVGWMCALALGWGYVIGPVASIIVGYPLPMFHSAHLSDILYAMLGIEGGTTISGHWAARRPGGAP